MSNQSIVRKTAISPTSEAEFQTDQVVTIAGGHFVHDTYSAFLSPLLPVLQAQLSTNYAMTGGLAIFAQIASLLNPFIGHLADKISLRYFIILAPAITGTLMSVIGLTSSYVGLAMLLFASGLSIAAFHAPAPAMVARVSGNQVGKGMSIFISPTSEVEDSGSSSPGDRTSIDSVRARKSRKGRWIVTHSRSVSVALASSTGTGLPGAIFISPLILRIPRMNCITQAITRSASSLIRD